MKVNDDGFKEIEATDGVSEAIMAIYDNELLLYKWLKELKEDERK